VIVAVLAAALTFAPVAGSAGTPVVSHAAHVAPNTPYTLVWRTGAARWNAHDGKFFGITAPDAERTIAAGTSDANGALDLRFTVPGDFGYIHDVELRSNGTVAATQGFTVIPRLTISPASGPLGTPITVTMTGVGYRFYQAVWHLMYDGAQTGWLSAITTHGTARVTIPATGGVGIHTLQALEGPGQPYLNETQSPNYQPLIPTVVSARFRITSGHPVLPRAVAQQLPARNRAPSVAAAAPSLALNFASGTVGSPVTIQGRGFAAATKLALEWETNVGNRISGNGWEAVQRPLASVTSDQNGAFAVNFRTPDDLGGDHRILVHALAADAPQTEIVYNVVPSVVGFTSSVRPGGPVTIHVKGGGWGDTGNIYTIVVDNAYFGYACSFNSQGDMKIQIAAPGQAGWHFVDLYPAIYNGKIGGPGSPPQGSEVNGSYLLLPMLNVVDHPGELLPAFHLAMRVQG
jgi:hypothetical protein